MIAFASSALLLTVIQPPISFWPLAWAAYVPFILACSPDVKIARLAIAGYAVSVCYWLGNIYWMGYVTVSGWITFCLYTALLWPLLAVSLRFCRVKKIPLFIAAAVLVVGAERLQGLFLGGFYWRYLAHSQYRNIPLIQIADIFGAAGVSFLVAMVNGLLAELLIEAAGGNLFRARNFFKTAVTAVLLLGSFAYGDWRLKQTPQFTEDGPLAGCVQSSVPQVVKESVEAADETLRGLLSGSKACAAAGAELMVWPETMVHARLDKRLLKILDESDPDRIFDRAVCEHSKDTGYVLVGAYGGKPKVFEDLSIRLSAKYNSAFLYLPAGRQADCQYNKIHLVPFGEVVPFKNSNPAIYRLLMKFTPYDYDYSLDAGTEFTVFPMTGKVRDYRFAVMICYEDAVPSIARGFVKGRTGRKDVDWLVNISNDGWFVRFSDGQIRPSTELIQHLSCSVFRAVEQRVAVLRSVNTGISCLIEPVGRIRDGFSAAGERFPHEAVKRQGVAGWFVDKVPIDKRITFFSRYGQWLDTFCAASILLSASAECIRLKKKNIGSNK